MIREAAARKLSAKLATALFALRRFSVGLLRWKKSSTATPPDPEYHNRFQELMEASTDLQFYFGAYAREYRRQVDEEARKLLIDPEFLEAIDFYRKPPAWLRKGLTTDDRTFLSDLKIRWEEGND